MNGETLSLESTARHAQTILDLLVDAGPLTAAEACEKLGWSRGRFGTALRHARDVLCPDLGLAIPQPIPTDGWLYRVTTEWQPVEAGAAYALGLVESRLASVARDIASVKPHLERGTREWRRANFLDKHLAHIVATLGEINGDEG